MPISHFNPFSLFFLRSFFTSCVLLAAVAPRVNYLSRSNTWVSLRHKGILKVSFEYWRQNSLASLMLRASGGRRQPKNTSPQALKRKESHPRRNEQELSSHKEQTHDTFSAPANQKRRRGQTTWAPSKKDQIANSDDRSRAHNLMELSQSLCI